VEGRSHIKNHLRGYSTKVSAEKISKEAFCPSISIKSEWRNDKSSVLKA